MSNGHRPTEGGGALSSFQMGLLQRLSWTIEDSSQTSSHPTETRFPVRMSSCLVKWLSWLLRSTTLILQLVQRCLITWSHRCSIQRLPCGRQFPEFNQSSCPHDSAFDVVSITVTLSVSGSGGLFVTRGAGSQQWDPLSPGEHLEPTNQFLFRDPPPGGLCSNILGNNMNSFHPLSCRTASMR